MNNTTTFKIFAFILYSIFNIIALCLGLYILFCYIPDKVLFITPYLILLNTLLFSIFWHIWKNELFETFLIFCCFACMNFSFVFLAPYAVDRSLSTFIFFYSIQHNGFPENSISDKYMTDFYIRRLNDGVNGNFLIKKDSKYYPTLRTKMYYNLMYPIGLATNSLENYNKFSNEVNKNIGDNNE
jgi:hypothetical protein